LADKLGEKVKVIEKEMNGEKHSLKLLFS